MNNVDELKLIRDALSGQTEAFERLLRPYRGLMLNTALRMTGNREDAAEICQEALVKIFRHLRSFKKDRQLKSWIYKITVNCALDFIDKRKKFEQLLQQHETELETQPLPLIPDPETGALNAEFRDTVRRCLQVLSPLERAVFNLRDGEGKTVKEAAKVLGCSSLSARVHLSRARRKLREELGKRYSIKVEDKKQKMKHETKQTKKQHAGNTCSQEVTA